MKTMGGKPPAQKLVRSDEYSDRLGAVCKRDFINCDHLGWCRVNWGGLSGG
jgi:hypothetical protein